MPKFYYAQQSPRGFANEVKTYRFSSKAARDKWVAEHYNDGDCNSAYIGAYACTRRQAYKTIHYRGDAITQSFNSSLLDGDRMLAGEYPEPVNL
jgi:hypothetical protein